MKTTVILTFVFNLMFAKHGFTQQIPVDSDINMITKKNQIKQVSFTVAQLTYDVSDNNLLVLLKLNQDNSLISAGKTVNFNTFEREKNRIFSLLSPRKFELKLKDIVFNVDTTLQKGFCTIKTVIKPLTQ